MLHIKGRQYGHCVHFLNKLRHFVCRRIKMMLKLVTESYINCINNIILFGRNIPDNEITNYIDDSDDFL